MKSKPKKTYQINQYEEEDKPEVSDGGPSIVAANRNKIIIASAVVVSLIAFYVLFGGDKKKPTDTANLTPVQQTVENTQSTPTVVDSRPQPQQVAPNQTGKSPFAFEEVDKKEKIDNIDLVAKQTKPEIPDLPELPKETVADNKAVADDKKFTDSAPQVANADLPTIPASQQQKISDLEKKIRDQELKIKEQEKRIEEKEIKKEIEKLQEEEKKELAIPARYAPIVILGSAGGGGGPANGIGYDKNIIDMNKNDISKLKKADNKVDATVIEDLEHTIAQGKIINAVLETAISTELPGGVRAIVSRDVFGESGKQVLIPRGSRLYGTYSTEVQFNQVRVKISWSNILRPDGVKLTAALEAGDEYGRAGVVGELDRRISSMIASTVLTSAFTLGASLAMQAVAPSNAANTTTISNISSGTTSTVSGAYNQVTLEVTKNILNIMKDIVDKAIDTKPVIRVPQGTKITVMATTDIQLPATKKRY